MAAPLSCGTPLEALRRAGDVDAATSTLADLPAPLLPTTDELPSEVVARLRRDER